MFNLPDTYVFGWQPKPEEQVQDTFYALLGYFIFFPIALLFFFFF